MARFFVARKIQVTSELSFIVSGSIAQLEPKIAQTQARTTIVEPLPMVLTHLPTLLQVLANFFQLHKIDIKWTISSLDQANKVRLVIGNRSRHASLQDRTAIDIKDT